MESVDTTLLKKFATSNLGEHQVLKELILEEQSEMSAEEFLIKISVWLKLLRKEEEKNNSVGKWPIFFQNQQKEI
ncbi:MAG: hypothetical protein NTX24_00595 [Candidatus Pacearchaeota archaeon]|nr:hypothetical protein [Candidatus Pacearchaeota archaeon]